MMYLFLKENFKYLGYYSGFHLYRVTHDSNTSRNTDNTLKMSITLIKEKLTYQTKLI